MAKQRTGRSFSRQLTGWCGQWLELGSHTKEFDSWSGTCIWTARSIWGVCRRPYVVFNLWILKVAIWGFKLKSVAAKPTFFPYYFKYLFWYPANPSTGLNGFYPLGIKHLLGI